MTTKKVLITCVLLIGCAAATVFVEAQSQQVSPVQFALTGITADQTARLTVSTLMTDGPRPVGCRATLMFVDAAGNAIVNDRGEPARKDVNLHSPGSSEWVDVTTVGAVSDTRLPMRPIVLIQDRFAGACLPQLEIIDNATQRTVILNPGVLVTRWGPNHNETLLGRAGWSGNHNETVLRDEP